MLEAIASAMPGVGFVIGGVVAAAFDPRASYVLAGAGVLAVLAAAAVMLRDANWRGAAEDAQAAGVEDASKLAALAKLDALSTTGAPG